MAFEEFEEVFGEVEPKWEQRGGGGGGALRPFLYRARRLDSERFQVVASDFHSTWERILTVRLIEDLRENTGFGSSWSEFFDYFLSSLSSGDVKLVLSALPNMTVYSGVVCATLIARNSSSMVFPSISLSLNKLTNSSANNVMADLSIAVFRAFKCSCNNLVKEQERCLRLTIMLNHEKDKKESLEKQLNPHSSICERKVLTSVVSCKASPISDILSDSSTMVTETQKPLDIPSAKDPEPKKVSHQAIPVYSRSKSRNVFLQNH